MINDLTEYPVERSVHGYNYDYVTSNACLELSLKVLKPVNGKYLARGGCLSATDYRGRFLADVEALGLEVVARKVYVPSFMEDYYLYEVVQKSAMNGSSAS